LMKVNAFRSSRERRTVGHPRHFIRDPAFIADGACARRGRAGASLSINL